MKLLILCDLFPPAFGPRMGYLCKYLARAGWEAAVLTEYVDDGAFAFLTGYAPVEYVRFYRAKSRAGRKAERLLVLAADFLFHYKDRKMAAAGARLLRGGGFGAILCSVYRS